MYDIMRYYLSTIKWFLDLNPEFPEVSWNWYCHILSSLCFSISLELWWVKKAMNAMTYLIQKCADHFIMGIPDHFIKIFWKNQGKKTTKVCFIWFIHLPLPPSSLLIILIECRNNIVSCFIWFSLAHLQQILILYIVRVNIHYIIVYLDFIKLLRVFVVSTRMIIIYS